MPCRAAGLCGAPSSKVWTDAPQRGGRDPADGSMQTVWWLWPLVALCSGDQFRGEAEKIMRATPVIDG